MKEEPKNKILINQEIEEENDFIDQAVKILRKTVENLDEKLFKLSKINCLYSNTNQQINQEFNGMLDEKVEILSFFFEFKNA